MIIDTAIMFSLMVFGGGSTFACARSESTTPHESVAGSPSLSAEQLMEFERRKKSPGIAVMLSVLLPSLGQVYVGDTRRGIGFIALLIILFIASIYNNVLIGLLGGVWLYHLYDAYQLAKKHNVVLLSFLTLSNEQ